MNEFDRILEELIKEKGGNKKSYLNLLNSIAYHESAHTLDPTIKQIGGGPGRGKYQFEVGKNRGAITAARRTKKYFDKKGIDTPKWLQDSLKDNSLDVSKLNSQQQDVLFLGNMRMHPKADLGKVVKGDQTVPEFWANYHWAGSPRDRDKRLKSFNNSLEDFKKKETTPDIDLSNMSLAPEKVKDAINIKQPNINKELINKFQKGGMFNTIRTKYANNSINEFNTGGLHEHNPLGGIPQGIGSNGKQNTVEQGETSFDIKGKKFIFSNRINTKGTVNQFVDGGPIDPPNKKVETGKNFVKSWFNNPITRAKLSMNKSQGLSKSITDIQKGLNNVDKVTTKQYEPYNDTTKAGYTPFDNEIAFYTEPNETLSTHEYTHAMGIDNDLSTYIKRNYGAIQLDQGKDYNEKQHIKYLNRNGELYSRVMELRQHLNAKPGQEITDDDIESLKDKNNDLFKYYKPEQIKDILNTVAFNNKKNGKRFIQAV